MALIGRMTAWIAGSDRVLDVAEELARRGASDAPPPVRRLAPRQRAAYDRLLDALNRLPRPMMVLGTLALIGTALVAPDWFAGRMEALARMPEGLWWIAGAVLSLHFGSRYQAHAQEHEREIVEVVAAAAPAAPAEPEPPKGPATPAVAAPGPDADVALATLATGPNAALAEWRAAPAA